MRRRSSRNFIHSITWGGRKVEGYLQGPGCAVDQSKYLGGLIGPRKITPIQGAEEAATSHAAEADNLNPYAPRAGTRIALRRRHGLGQGRAFRRTGCRGAAPDVGARAKPRISKLPPVVEPKRVNGVPWPEALPASKNLLPRR